MRLCMRNMPHREMGYNAGRTNFGGIMTDCTADQKYNRCPP
jgi:hypothetical protein